jgi:hypothetical protein
MFPVALSFLLIGNTVRGTDITSEAAIAEIEKLGGIVSIDVGQAKKPVVGVTFITGDHKLTKKRCQEPFHNNDLQYHLYEQSTDAAP